MAFYDTAWWHGLHLLGLLCALLLTGVAPVRSRTVQGSHHRFVCATAQWALTGPAALLWVTAMVQGHARSDVHQTMLGIVVATFWALDVRALLRDGDDNWFKRTGRSLRRWVNDRLAGMLPMPQGAGA